MLIMEKSYDWEGSWSQTGETAACKNSVMLRLFATSSSIKANSKMGNIMELKISTLHSLFVDKNFSHCSVYSKHRNYKQNKSLYQIILDLYSKSETKNL